MKNIIIVAPYPNSENIKDGMVQRIVSIDKELSDYKRTYISISIKHNFIKTIEKKSNDVTVIKLNIFFHYFLVYYYIKKASIVYFHSIFNYMYAALFNIKGKECVLDIHGAVPDEELYSNGHTLKYHFLKWVEKRAFEFCKIFICVSNNMKDHYIRKYPHTVKCIYIIKPIIPTNSLKTSVEDNRIATIKKDLSIDDNNVVFIYSGNVQQWQNIDLMLDEIKKINNPYYKFIILTGSLEQIYKMIDDRNMDGNNLIIRSVLPEELNVYYTIAHYGFLLRDNHILNHVASPTKLTEYLFYGITPILKYDNVGDRHYYGYEYLNISDNLKDLKPYKSEININIAKDILNKNYISIKDILNL